MVRLEIWARPNADIEAAREQQRWYRKGVWEDGEIVDGTVSVLPHEDADDIRRSYDGRNTVVVEPNDRGDFLQKRVDRGLVTRSDVQEANLQENTGQTQTNE